MTDQPISDAELRREAERIYDDVWNARLELPDGTTAWIGYDSADGTPSLAAGTGLYRGQLGVATYFAAMYRVFGDERYRESVSRATGVLFEEDAEEQLQGVGIGEGFGSLAYGLSVLTELTGDRRYLERALEFARAFTDEAIARDDDYDLLTGTAGALTGLLRLYEHSGESVALDRAVACGDHLLDNRYDKWGYEVWDTHESEQASSFATGMGHGAAGIGYALYRLSDHAGRGAFREAADDAVAFENVFYSPDRNDWKANWTHVPAYPRWWCYGLPGVGLARLGSLHHHESGTLRRDVDRVRAFEPRLASTDQLCHGTFSQVALLVELATEFGDEYAAKARTLAANAIERKRSEGGYRLPPQDGGTICNPALFLGTAGVGYALLRVLAPDEIPCLLGFE